MRPIFSYIKYLIFVFGVLCSTITIAQDFSNKGRDTDTDMETETDPLMEVR